MNERDVFIVALEIESPQDRKAFLDQACGGDTSLRERVEALLRAHQKGNSFLENPPVVAAAATLDQPITEGPGTVIGPYKLLQQIGEGGMGVVYMAEQTEPVERRVALKIIKPGMDTRQVIARFEAERQALALMDHPNIAKVLDARTTESGRPYFVMELVKGVPITQYCDEHHLTPRGRLELFVPVCQAVQHAHQKGIIHRDIKPSNVLVAEYDDRAVPKIIDFGVAKAVDQRLTEKTMFTQFGQVVGTVDYMSPEQANLNQLDIDTRSDIYSLGVLLYELLTGETPFDRARLRSAAFDELLRIIREEEPPKPSLRLSTSDTLPSIAANRHTEPKKLSTLVRGELDWIVMRAMEKDRARRYETASGFASDIQRYLNDDPVVACPPSAAYRFRKFARRNRVVLSMVALVSAALLLGIVGTTWQAIRATRQRNRAVTAEHFARDQAERADIEAANARTEAAIAQAVNQFINKDLLGSANPDAEPDRDLRVREVLDRAYQNVQGRFADQPLVKAQILHTLGNAYHALGEYEKAEELHGEAMEIRRQLLGKEHPATLGSMNGLANATSFQNRYEEAEKLHYEVLEIRRRVLGPEHPDTLTSMHNLGTAISGQGRKEEAENLDRDVLDIRRRVLGPEHPDTLKSMGALAIAIVGRGRYEEAEGLSREVLESQQRVLGAEHPDSLTSSSALATAVQRQRRYSEAEKLCGEMLEIQRRVLGPEHPRTLVTMHNLAAAIGNQGRDVAKLFHDVLEIRRRVLGPDHPETLASMRNYAMALIREGKHAEAAAQLSTLLALEPKDYQHWMHLAQCHLALGNQEEHEKACRSMIEQFPEPDQRSLADWGHLGQALYRAGRYEQAREALEKVIELRGDEGPTVELGPRWWYYTMTLCRLGEPERARAYLEQLVEVTKENPPANKAVHSGLRTEAAELLGIEGKEEPEEQKPP